MKCLLERWVVDDTAHDTLAVSFTHILSNVSTHIVIADEHKAQSGQESSEVECSCSLKHGEGGRFSRLVSLLRFPGSLYCYIYAIRMSSMPGVPRVSDRHYDIHTSSFDSQRFADLDHNYLPGAYYEISTHLRTLIRGMKTRSPPITITKRSHVRATLAMRSGFGPGSHRVFGRSALRSHCPLLT